MSLFPKYTPAKPAKAAKVETALVGLVTLAVPTTSKTVPVAPLPDWQYDFCVAHAEFNQCRGSCPCSIDDCLISRVVDAGGDINKLRGLEIGQGITTDMVIDEWMDAGESVEDLFKNPTWLICMAEVICSCK